MQSLTCWQTYSCIQWVAHRHTVFPPLSFDYSLTSELQAPAKEETLQVFERMKDMGVLIGKGGLLGNVFRIKPPMCITEQDADFLLEVMDIALSELWLQACVAVAVLQHGVLAVTVLQHGVLAVTVLQHGVLAVTVLQHGVLPTDRACYLH